MKTNVAIGLVALFLSLPALADITINEIRIDQPGTDNDEYFELTGLPFASLNDLTYLVIGDGTGGSGVIEAVVNLTGYSIPADGYFLAVETTSMYAPNADLVLAGNGLNFENDDNVTHLLVSGWTGTNGMDLDLDDDGVLDLTPWTSLLDSIALVKNLDVPPTGTEWWYGPTIGPDGPFVPGHVYRYENGFGPWNIGLFDISVGVDTPGYANVPEPASLMLLGLGVAGLIRRR